MPANMENFYDHYTDDRIDLDHPDYIQSTHENITVCSFHGSDHHTASPTLGIRYYMCGPLMSVLATLGILSNSVFLYILVKTRPIPVVNYYMIPLCLCDFCVILGSILMFNLPYLIYERIVTHGTYAYFFPFLNYFSNFAYTCCVWLVVSLSAERYYAVCYPYAHRLHNAKRRAMVISTCCLAGSILYNLPRYFELITHDCYDFTSARTVAVLKEAEFRRSSVVYWIAYKLVLGKMCLSLGPLVILCALSVLMWRPVRESHRFMDRSKTIGDERSALVMREIHVSKRGMREDIQQKRGNSEKHSNTLTYTLFCVVLKFLICHTLPSIIDLCESVMDDEQFHMATMDYLVDTSTLLVVANSSLNFFIHVWCSRQFRKSVKKALAFGDGSGSGNGKISE